MQRFWIENRVSGIGGEIIGNVSDALRYARSLVCSDVSAVSVYNAANEVIAQFNWGNQWIREDMRHLAN